MYLVKAPFFLKWIYPGLIWNRSRTKKRIYLTFDDGPVPVVTPFVLKTLNEYQAKATFFCIGDNIKKYPQIFENLLAAGHSVGNHTFNHLKGWDTSKKIYLENVALCSTLMSTDLFRPPYGRATRSQYRHLRKQYRVIMWDVLSGDFDTDLSPGDCLKNVLKHAGNGSIVVFHDSEKAFERLKYALPSALKIWKDAGYEFAVF